MKTKKGPKGQIKDQKRTKFYQEKRTKQEYVFMIKVYIPQKGIGGKGLKKKTIMSRSSMRWQRMHWFGSKSLAHRVKKS